MISIRFYLVAAILACITLINFLSALHGYRSSMSAADRLFDQQLTEMARMLALARQKRIERGFPGVVDGDFSAFQIWTDDGVIIARSPNVPLTAIAPLETGYHDRNFGGYRWRIFVHYDSSVREWTIIGERSDTRYGLAEKVILESILPTVLALPIVALMIWGIVGLGLKPLRKLTGQLRSKEADDLTPITMDAFPDELKPLLESTNGLLTRLEASFLREKRFAADAAHELRTPISALKVHLYNLEAEWTGQAAGLLPLKKGIDRMSHLVEQILALHRSTPDQFMAKFEDIELFELTRKVIASVYDQFDEKHQKIELNGEPAMLTGDRFALETLLQNLLANACKYSRQGGEINVTIDAVSSWIQLQIEDSGPGIPKDRYQRVFERFYRLNGDQHDSGTLGCGLGLAIVKDIAQLHGASIKLAPSRFKSGLSVTLWFPKPMAKLNQNAKGLSLTEISR